MPKMKIAVVPKPGVDFVIEEREIPTPGPGQVRIKVSACGVCASDHLVKDGLVPWIQYPRSPGHEVAGVIDEVGPNVTAWKKGQKVGVGWHGGHDFTCIHCRRGDFINCVNEKWTGIHYDGGYAEYMVAPWEAVAAMPDALDPTEAAPLLCAGITTFNAVGSAIWEFSLRISLDTKLWRSAKAKRARRWRKNWALMFTLTAQRWMRRRS
jgi:D-arabinose 1-dehydrogenase-like Zn-dependent alcohol dehydrogenase